MTNVAVEKLRVDKWLWYARFFKTRTLASQQVTAGHLRVNSQPIRKAGYMVKAGDVLTFPKADDIRVIEIVDLGEKRKGASEAALLYNDLDPPVRKIKSEQPPVAGLRERGAGRPTKKERRETDALRSTV